MQVTNKKIIVQKPSITIPPQGIQTPILYMGELKRGEDAPPLKENAPNSFIGLPLIKVDLAFRKGKLDKADRPEKYPIGPFGQTLSGFRTYMDLSELDVLAPYDVPGLTYSLYKDDKKVEYTKPLTSFMAPFLQPVMGGRVEDYLSGVPFENYSIHQEDLRTGIMYDPEDGRCGVFVAKLYPHDDPIVDTDSPVVPPNTILARIPPYDWSETCFSYKDKAKVRHAALMFVNGEDKFDLQIQLFQYNAAADGTALPPLRIQVFSKLYEETIKQFQFFDDDEWYVLGKAVVPHLTGTIVGSVNHQKTMELVVPSETYHECSGICWANLNVHVDLAATIRKGGFKLDTEHARAMFDMKEYHKPMANPRRLNMSNAVNLYTCDAKKAAFWANDPRMEFYLIANHDMSEKNCALVRSRGSAFTYQLFTKNSIELMPGIDLDAYKDLNNVYKVLALYAMFNPAKFDKDVKLPHIESILPKEFKKVAGPVLVAGYSDDSPVVLDKTKVIPKEEFEAMKAQMLGTITAAAPSVPPPVVTIAPRHEDDELDGDDSGGEKTKKKDKKHRQHHEHKKKKKMKTEDEDDELLGE